MGNMKKKYIVAAGLLLLLIFFIFGFVSLALADEPVYRATLKVCSGLAAVMGLIGIAAAGYFAGRDFDSYTGWERYTHGAGMYYNRRPFRREAPTYQKTDQARRLNWEDSLANRMGMMRELVHPADGGEPEWVPSMGIGKLPEPLRSYFQEREQAFRNTLKAFELIGRQKANWDRFKVQFALADAWSTAVASSFEDHEGEMYFDRLYPEEPKGPPQEWDFRGIRREKPLPFKSPKHASELIKKITHTFGATLVGITKLNPDWCYQGMLRGVGPGRYEIPGHWEYAIVFATPHEWDQMYVNPTYGTSYDAYDRERSIAGKLETFLHELGYPARAHVPPFFYDMVMPPVAIDAGLGEQGRKGLLITPELGSNARLACITTSLPMEVDKPVDLGIQDFCRKCKICAERCPGGCISHKERPDIVRGYRRWEIKHELCFHIWASVATSHVRGCRVCLAVCPYTRKNNWVHSTARYIDPRDPTGIAASTLLWVQKAFFKYPQAKEFMPPPEGKNATYHQPPDWLQTDKWFDVDKNW
jgi:epoxyqueuosine reductase